jgi:hypothetical protein
LFVENSSAPNLTAAFAPPFRLTNVRVDHKILHIYQWVAKMIGKCPRAVRRTDARGGGFPQFTTDGRGRVQNRGYLMRSRRGSRDLADGIGLEINTRRELRQIDIRECVFMAY